MASVSSVSQAGCSSTEATCVRLQAKADNAAALAPALEDRVLSCREGEVLVEVRAAAVNPSDVKAATGLMPYAVFPRTPGRDFAGVVIGGPAQWLGREVMGSSGDLGIRRDGSHASHLVIESEALVGKPDGVSFEEAAGIGVPFVTAMEGFRRAGLPVRGETVLVMGINGKVGQAAAQIATSLGADVIGVARRREPYCGHASGNVEMIDSASQDVAAVVRQRTRGRGADIVFNTVGDAYFQDAHSALALKGRQILIATASRSVPFDILGFYRGQHTYVGIDTLGLSSIATADVLRPLMPGFASGRLRPFPINADCVFALAQAPRAYIAVANGARERILLQPQR